MTALHLSAKYGHVSILKNFEIIHWGKCSKKVFLNFNKY